MQCARSALLGARIFSEARVLQFAGSMFQCLRIWTGGNSIGGSRGHRQARQSSFQNCPASGRKTAQRLAYHILSACPRIRCVSSPYRSLTAKSRCISARSAATSPTRIPARSARIRAAAGTSSAWCAIPRDVNAMERMRDYNGLYHVLHGVISPMNGVGPDDIRIRELMSRLSRPARSKRWCSRPIRTWRAKRPRHIFRA